MDGDGGRQVVVVDPGRWNGIVVELPAQLLSDGLPPSEFLVRVRETLPGVEPRERDVRLRHVAEIGTDLFYSPVPGQHVEDPVWQGVRRAVVGVRPVPPREVPAPAGAVRRRQPGPAGRPPGPMRP